MKTRSLNILFASALGAGVGAMVALQVVVALWWVGLIVGGAVGYLSYEWKQVVTAIPRAYRAAKGWRPQPSFRKVVGLALRDSIVAGSWGGPIFGWFLWIVVLLDDPTQSQPVWWVVFFVAGATVGSILACFLLETILVVRMDEIQLRLVGDNTRHYEWRQLAPYVLFRFLLEVPSYILNATVSIARFLPRFAWSLFVRIHSEERLICGVDAMFGTAIGFFAGSALVGAIAGGILGVLNYEVITRRWLIPAGYVPVKIK